jgi:hypothetical protein
MCDRNVIRVVTPNVSASCRSLRNLPASGPGFHHLDNLPLARLAFAISIIRAISVRSLYRLANPE